MSAQVVDKADAKAASRIAGFIELCKPRISTLLLIIACASFMYASRDHTAEVRLLGLVKTIITVVTLSIAIFPFNHWMERKEDELMLRTRSRPLPSGLLRGRDAIAISLAGLVLNTVFTLALVDVLTFAVCVFVEITYLAVYTPLKYRTPFHTGPGALSGAAPPLIGFAIANGSLGAEAYILFAVLFFWQYPHFLSIDLIYKDDYAKAGIRVLTVVDTTGRITAAHIVVAMVLLAASTVLPVVLGFKSIWYLIVAILADLGFLYFGLRAIVVKDKMSAKYLLRSSILYLPLIFLIYGIL